jgi:putative tryptophan/tyrosine transport system substrate-binding protein
MKLPRREFIGLVGAVAAGWPLVVGAQQSKKPVIGFLNGQTAAAFTHLVAGFQHGLNENGYVEGQNVAIEYRWADRQADRLSELAADLVRHNVDVIVATGGANFGAKAATTTIPIVATFGSDPVKEGFVASLNRPDGNITGMTVFSAELEVKRFELLNEIVPRGAVLGYLLDPGFEAAAVQRQSVETASRTMGRELRIVEASNDADLEKAFAALLEAHIGGLGVSSNQLFNSLRDHLLALTTRLRIPTIHEVREFTAAGGLMSYGTNIPDVYRQLGVYTARVLKGDRPGDLPIIQPTKFDMAVNLKTAKALGIDVPTSILLRADEVIE